MTASSKIQSQKEKVARITTSRIRQLAVSLNDVAEDAVKPIYTERVIGEEFQETLAEALKLAAKLSDILVPKDPKTGRVDAGKLVQAVASYHLQPGVPPKEKKPSEKKIKTAKASTSKPAKRRKT